MRIVVNGQQAFGAEVFKALLERGDSVVAVYCAPDRPGAGPDPLRSAAEDAGVPVRQPSSFKDPQVADEMRQLAPDLMVMAFVTLIVPEPVLAIPRLGSIQYHPSVLPRHRGPSAINWAIIHGDRTTGISIFWPDDGLDTGPLLLTREVDIAPDDTLGSLYFDKLFPVGVQAMLEAIDLVTAGRAPRIPQDEAQATYEGWCRSEDVAIDWDRPAGEVYDLIRGSDPRPGAWTVLGDQRIALLDARLAEHGSGRSPGEVVAVDDDGLAVAAADGVIRVGRVRTDANKVPASQYARELGLGPGARLQVRAASAGD